MDERIAVSLQNIPSFESLTAEDGLRELFFVMSVGLEHGQEVNAKLDFSWPRVAIRPPEDLCRQRSRLLSPRNTDLCLATRVVVRHLAIILTGG